MPSIMVKRCAPAESAYSTAPVPQCDDAAAAANVVAADADHAVAVPAATATASKKPRIYPHDAQCPSITATTIKALKWGDSREIISPFLNAEERATIHKLTRSELSKLVDARVLAGDVTPQQFWAVVGTDKVRQQKNKQKDKTVDPIVAAALMKKNSNSAVMGSSPVDARASLQQPHKGASMPLSTNPTAGTGASLSPLPHPKPPTPYLPGSTTALAPKSAPSGSSGGGGGNLVRSPFVPLPRPQYKYVLRSTLATGNSSGGGGTKNIPPAIVVGEPIPPNPFTPPSVSGTLYSSALLPFDGKVIQPGKVIPQTEFLYNTLIILLSQVSATLSDIVNMTVWVVDIERNGNDVLMVHERLMREMNGNPCTPCAYTMMGVSQLMKKGCLVQMQVTAMVRRGLMANLMLESGNSHGGSGRPLPLTAAAAPSRAPKAATVPTPRNTTTTTTKKKTTATNTRVPASAVPFAIVGKRGRGRPKKNK